MSQNEDNDLQIGTWDSEWGPGSPNGDPLCQVKVQSMLCKRTNFFQWVKIFFKQMICAGCSCDGELHNLQAADPHDQEKRAGTSKLDIGKQMSRDIDGTKRREREGEVKRGRLKG